jgi:hypothetical protein
MPSSMKPLSQRTWRKPLGFPSQPWMTSSLLTRRPLFAANSCSCFLEWLQFFCRCTLAYWLRSSKIVRHFVSIESPVSFSGVPLTVVEEEEIVEFWAQHIQTINHIFQLKCHMEVPRCVHQCATRPSTILRQPFSVSFADSSI